MDKAERKQELWSTARLCLQGAYGSITVAHFGDPDQLLKLGVPHVGDPKQLLEFLHFHMQERADVRSQPIHHVFSALIVASNQETDDGLATHSFVNSPLIDTTIEALENKAFVPLQRSTIFVLVKLDNHLFATDEAFRDPRRASRFVAAWSSAIHELLGDLSLIHQTTILKVLFAIAHLPCLREHLPRERWSLIGQFPHIRYLNPPLQRCLEDTSIYPFLKIVDPDTSSLWLAMLWIMHYHLSPEVREQLEEETRKIAAGDDFYDLESYLKLFDSYLSNFKTQIEGLDPLDRAASLLRGKRERLIKSKQRLTSIRDSTERKVSFLK